MERTQEAKIPWILWQLFLDIEEFLWQRYEDQFLDFIMEEEEEKYMHHLADTETDLRDRSS
jgi:hypothetical protein